MSFPYFSFFIGDLPGEPTSIFALARRLAANADSIGDAGEAINALDAAAPSWTGASFEAFNASKWNGTSDAFRLAEGLREAAGILDRHAWAMEARQSQVAGMKAILVNFDQKVDAAPDNRKTVDVQGFVRARRGNLQRIRRCLRRSQTGSHRMRCFAARDPSY